jgi:HTH-type transcriptional regulator / antitoxin HipB
MDSMGTFVTSCRRKSGMTQLELARLAGVGKTAVFDIEHGKQTVRFDTLMRVLAVLSIRVALHGPLGEAVTVRLTADGTLQAEGGRETR